ncbi:hypothetical protein XELAEV_18030621mg [Xenopus laevis]|uniref:Uncharacterized protein n=1 Tax=Xenopus laevis TaxID=8355 RepID=A0A974CML5_XENLA|nr:hypothetical protein XELAEV_18030621mg [Xenopus laevis]
MQIRYLSSQPLWRNQTGWTSALHFIKRCDLHVHHCCSSSRVFAFHCSRGWADPAHSPTGSDLLTSKSKLHLDAVEKQSQYPLIPP